MNIKKREREKQTLKREKKGRKMGEKKNTLNKIECSKQAGERPRDE